MSSLMLEEARSAADRIADQLMRNAELMAEIGRRLRLAQPHGVVTLARGSSDHAASYFAYLCMQKLGIPVASLSPSLTTLAHAPWQLQGQVAVAISQSGQSPDLIATQQALAAGGARTLALINTPGSPLGEVSEIEVPLLAGEEHSVAATKSYLATLSACAQLLGHWSEDPLLLEALDSLPEQLRAAAAQDWNVAIEALSGADKLMVIGRGAGLAIAREAALKFKETCAIQAEAFSSAEIKHGPMALIGPDYSVLIFAPPGPEQPGLLELANWLRGAGARVLLAADENIAERELTLSDAGHVSLQPLTMIQSFYVMAAGLAAARGSDPDRPRHLRKVTRTL